MSPTRFPLEALYRRPGFLLRRAHQVAAGLFEERFRVQRLTAPQFGVLYTLASCRALDQSALARALGYDKVTTLRIVRGLQERALVSRESDPSHGRKIRLRLTDAGEILLHASMEPAEDQSRELLAPLAPAEQTQLIDLLEKLCNGHGPHARGALDAPQA